MMGVSSAYNFSSIGNVGLYASNMVKNYMATAKSSSALQQDNSFASVTSNAVKNTTAFAGQNVANLRSLKSAANGLNNAARGLGSYSSEKDLVSAAQNFASAYNKTVSFLTSGLADGEGVSKALNLVADNRMTELSMANYGTYTARRLSSLGMSIDEDGKMVIDAQKLTDAAAKSPATVKSMLTGYGSITEVTQSNASEAMRIPVATYTDFSNMKVSDSMIDMLLPKTGFLFDFSL